MAQMGQEKLFEFPQVRGDVGAEAAHPESRALETDASGLNALRFTPIASSRTSVGRTGCSKPAGVQTLISQSSIEAFHVTVLHRPSRLNVDQQDLAFLAPAQEMARG